MKIKMGGDKDFYPTLSGISVDPDKIPESSCDSIVANNHIEFLPLNEVGGFMKFNASRLKSGGKLYMAGTDCLETSRLMFTNDINIEQFNRMLLNGRRSARCLVTIKSMMEQVGLVPVTMMLAGLGNCEYYITGVKP